MARIDRVAKTSDVKFEITIMDSSGVPVDPLTLRWEFQHYVWKNKMHTASYDLNKCTGCTILNNKIIIPIPNIDLGIGRLIRRSIIYYPDPQMPGGLYKDVSEQKLNVEIYEL